MTPMRLFALRQRGVELRGEEGPTLVSVAAIASRAAETASGLDGSASGLDGSADMACRVNVKSTSARLVKSSSCYANTSRCNYSVR